MIMSALGGEDIYNAMQSGITTRLEFESFNLSILREYESCVNHTKDEGVEKYVADFEEEALYFALSEIDLAKKDTLPYKISVSEIKNGEFSKSESTIEPVKAPEFILQTNAVSPAFVGTSMHTFMQFCSFDIYTKEDCIKEAKRLVRDGFILPEHEKALDFDKLSRIFTSPLFDQIRKSAMVEREKRYTLITKASDVIPAYQESCDTDILVQGVVDCYFENADGTITLIDFKTDRVNKSDGKQILLERHSEQLKLYANALYQISHKKVSKIYIWSFALCEAIEITI
jgi:ATP-dependent helicase/nuclease subunit A